MEPTMVTDMLTKLADGNLRAQVNASPERAFQLLGGNLNDLNLPVNLAGCRQNSYLPA